MHPDLFAVSSSRRNVAGKFGPKPRVNCSLYKHQNVTKPGKRIGNTVYVHRSAADQLNDNERDTIKRAESLASPFSFEPNVIKVSSKIQTVSFLLYEDFNKEAFPALLESIAVNLGLCRINRRSYGKSSNPPILHRKELLLPSNDPKIHGFSALTRDLEQRGAFASPHLIGHRKQWAERLSAMNLIVIDHTVVDLE